MNLFKRIAGIILASVIAIGVAGCTSGENTAEPTNNGDAEVTAEPTEEPTAEPTPEPTRAPKENVAKVILLLGQSNAVGSTFYTALKASVGAAKYKEIQSGYENVRTVYFCEAGNADGQDFSTNVNKRSTTVATLFKKTKFGMSWDYEFFGPEVGMADYLSTNYPDETFYIVKVAKGAVSIAGSWVEGKYCWTKMDELVGQALDMLKSEGYTPEICGICWMQGENEACSESDANDYLNLQSDLVARLREKYAEYAPYGGIPFIDAGISSYWKYYKIVNEKKAEFAASSDLNYYFDTMEMGFTYDKEPAGNPDYCHFDAESVWLLGQEFGKVLSEAYEKVK